MNQRIIDATKMPGRKPVDATTTMEQIFGPMPVNPELLELNPHYSYCSGKSFCDPAVAVDHEDIAQNGTISNRDDGD
jgi:hypothetical protein